MATPIGETLEDCGCFTFPDGFWPCPRHRGETPEMRERDEQQHAWEAVAMNGWTDGRRSD